MSESQENKKVEEQGQLLGTIDECGERKNYHNLVDILFVIDTTGSMGWCISQLKKTVCKVMKKFSDKQYNIKFAIEVYRDHPPQEYSYVEKHFDLRNQDDIIKVIDQECDVAGGGDTPEAVFDGLVNGLKNTKWRIGTDGKTKSKRFLFHGCDAPSHGKQYGCSSTSKQWSQKGCPCGFTRHDVKKLLDEYDVDYSMIKCGNQVDIMSALFKECFGERFKREIQIKQGSSSYGGGKVERKGSLIYMKEIGRQEGLKMKKDMDMGTLFGSPPAGRALVEKSKPILHPPAPQKKTSSILSTFKNLFGTKQDSKKESIPPSVHRSKGMQKAPDLFGIVPESMAFSVKKSSPSIKQQKQCKKSVLEKQEEYEANSDDSGEEGKPRSMASLVLSDIEDGIQSHFQPEKKKQKVTKDI